VERRAEERSRVEKRKEVAGEGEKEGGEEFSKSFPDIAFGGGVGSRRRQGFS
jgi:hypothetical protein